MINLADHQKDSLLSMSLDFISAKGPQELLRTLYKRIKPILPFDNAGLFIIDKEKDIFFEVLESEILPDDPIQRSLDKNGFLGPFKYSGFPEGAIMYAEKTQIYDCEEQSKLIPNPQWDSMLAEGLREMIGGPLMYYGEKIGFFCFNSKERGVYSSKDKPLFEAIGTYLTIALKNLIDKENILYEKRISDNLLKTINKINSGPQLTKTLFNEVKEIFPFDDAGLFAINYEHTKERDLITDYHKESPISKQIYDSGIYGWRSLSKVVQDLANKGPIIYNMKDFYDQYDHPDFEFTKKENFQQIIGGPLKVGDQLIGMLCFWSRNQERFHKESFPLFQAISQQLGIALDNLLKREHIELLNKELKMERDYLIQEVKEEYNYEEIIGNSLPLKEVFKSIDKVAETDSTVLILGETGTGKELIARAIHNRSGRNKKAMIKLNCATLPDELIESELFGHEKGSFTGAHQRRIGKFELADNGTLFLDEVGEMPLKLQSKLLRVLQEQEFERIGGKDVIKVNVRIIAATNKDLEKEVHNGNFRQDLYYRLSVFPIYVPSLNERKEDIPLLATYFSQVYAKKFNVPFSGIKDSAMRQLINYEWPGNVRELQNLVEQSTIMNQGRALTWARDLSSKSNVEVRKHKESSRKIEEVSNLSDIIDQKEKEERDLILKALKQSKGKVRGKNGAAELLDIKANTLEYRMKKLGIK